MNVMPSFRLKLHTPPRLSKSQYAVLAKTPRFARRVLHIYERQRTRCVHTGSTSLRPPHQFITTYPHSTLPAHSPLHSCTLPPLSCAHPHHCRAATILRLRAQPSCASRQLRRTVYSAPFILVPRRARRAQLRVSKHYR